jgi:hypothetical protein
MAITSKIVQTTKSETGFNSVLSQRKVTFNKSQKQNPININYHAHGHLKARPDNNTGIPGIQETIRDGRPVYQILNNMGYRNQVKMLVYIGGGSGSHRKIDPSCIGSNNDDALLKAVIIRQKMQSINHYNTNCLYTRNTPVAVTQKTIRKTVKNHTLTDAEMDMVDTLFDNWSKRVRGK